MQLITLPRSLPSTEKFSQLVERYQSFRLLSLKLSPEAFGSTYAREVAFPVERWISRVSNPVATNLVAISRPDSESSQLASNESDLDLILAHEWLASLTLIGPFDVKATVEAIKNDMHFNPDPVIDGETEMYFFLNGMYTLPSARGQGLGPALVEYSKNVASELASKRKGRLVLVVDYENEFARRTYEKCGFAIIQRYWFDDYREGRSERTEAAVMKFDIGN